MESQTDHSVLERTLDRIFTPPPEADDRDEAEGASRRVPTSPGERKAIVVVALVAAVLGALSPASPSTWRPAGLLLAAGFAGLLSLAASRARRWTWVVSALVAILFSQSAVLLIVAGSGLVAASVSAPQPHRRRWVGAVVGGLTAQVLLRLPEVVGTGGSALVATAAALPVLLSGYQLSPPRLKRRVKIAVAVGGAFVALASIVAGLTLFLARDSVEDGVRFARAGRDAARNGDVDEAATMLDRAADEFDRGATVAGGWWTAPVRLVPIVGQQVDAVDRAATQGLRLTDAAYAASVAIDLDELTWRGGALDLAALEAVQQPLRTNADVLGDTVDVLGDLDSPWLLSPVSERIDTLRDEVTEVYPDALFAADAAELGPALLGADGPRTYFVVFTQPAEARGIGGFMGSWAVLQARGGKVTMTASGRTAELERAGDPATRVLDTSPTADPDGRLADYVGRYGSYDPANLLRDITLSPDFPSIAAALGQLYPQSGGVPLDGVILVDPYALAALMEFTGPIQIPGVDRPLTADNAAEFLLTEQYLEFPDRAERVDFLGDASEETFDRLTNGDLPGPRRIADRLAPMAEDRHLMLYSAHPDEEHLFERGDIDGTLVDDSTVDYFSVVQQNAGNNKIDAYLERDISYDVVVDPSSGRLEAVATIELTNAIPTVDLPRPVVGNSRGLPLGTNESYVHVYSPLEVSEATLDGAPVALEVDRELGRRVYAAQFAIPPGETRTLVLELDGQREPFDRYELAWGSQPLVRPDRATVTVRGAPGVLLAPSTRPFAVDPGRHSASLSGALTDSPLLAVDLDPQNRRP